MSIAGQFICHDTTQTSILLDQNTVKVDVPILAIITGQDPTGKQVHLHSKPRHTTERPVQEPPKRLQWLQQQERNLFLCKW
jgi:hypothetical protein